MLISVTQQPVVTLYDATLQLHGLSLLNQATKGLCDCSDESDDDSESVITVKHYHTIASNDNSYDNDNNRCNPFVSAQV